MWIKRVTFENFINFYVGLGMKKITLDFSNRENTICLIIGPNGVGKTSLLSYLTPFSTVGNLDVRDGNPLIIEGERGYKRIIIMDAEVEYNIEHFYTPTKNGHSVKSYFKRDGKELNENGNVTSFKELVAEFFHIDMDYLKLIRIGDNVNNLIRLKAAERKNFMAKFLDSVNIYLKYYKKITADVRDINTLISHTTDKLQRIPIGDKEVFQSEITSEKKADKVIEEELESLTGILSTLSFQMKEILDSSSVSSINELNKEKSNLRNLLKKWEKAMEEKKKFTAEELRVVIKEMESGYNQLIGECSGLSVSKNSHFEILDSLYRDLTILKKEYEMEKSESKIDSLEEYISTLHQKRIDIEKTLTGERPLLSKEEVDEFLITIKTIQRTLFTSYEFGKDPVKEAVDLLENGSSIEEYVAGKLVAIEKDGSIEKTYLDKLVDKYANIKRPEGCDCVLLSLYDDLMVVRDLQPQDPKKVRTAEYYQMVSAVFENLEQCLEDLNGVQELIKKLPKEIRAYFQQKNLFDNLRKCEMIYPEKEINQLLSMVTEFHTYDKIVADLENTIEQLNREKETSKLEFYENRISEITERIHAAQEAYQNVESTLSKKEKKKAELAEEIENYKTLLDAVTKYESTIEEEREIDDCLKRYDSLGESYDNTLRRKVMREKDRKILRESIQQKEAQLQEYERLTKELEKAREIYDDLIAIKTSTSNTKGIPLFYIELYLEDVTEIANELLDIVYHGDLYLDKFDIQADSFRIPFVKNGKMISDISYASQGEQSFLSMAISFALGAKNMTDYNIPLLDEVDGVFDKDNREHCLSIIEKQNDIIQCEQEFIISHNNMYDQYPVDVLDLGNLQESKFFVA